MQRRRRWTPEDKIRIVEETYLPGNSVSLVARQHGIAGNQLFTWRRLMAQGALTAATAGEEVVPASGLPRVGGPGARASAPASAKRRWRMNCCVEAVSRAAGPKKQLLRSTSSQRPSGTV